MTNQDRAADVIRTWQKWHQNVMDKDPDWAAQNLACDLYNAGVLASDLPEPFPGSEENTMNNLSTDNLQQLLDHSTPGPWTFVEDIADTPSGTQEIGHIVYKKGNELGDWLFGVWDDPVTDDYPANLPLTALAPELAHEVIRLRNHINSLITTLEGEAAAKPPVSAETIANYLKNIVLKETG